MNAYEKQGGGGRSSQTVIFRLDLRLGAPVRRQRLRRLERLSYGQAATTLAGIAHHSRSHRIHRVHRTNSSPPRRNGRRRPHHPRKSPRHPLPPRQEVVAPPRATELLTPAPAFKPTCCRILLAFHLHSAGEVGVNQFGDRARYTLAILFAINLLNFYDRQIPGALVEPIRKQWALTDSQIGWLATAFTLLYAVVGVPFGRLSDRWKRPQLLSLGVAAWSLLTAASGLAWGYGSLFAARLGVGVGEATCAPTANSLIGDLYPAARRARALSLFMLGLPIGNFLGSFVSGHVAAAYGWRMAFYVACLPGLLLAVLAMRVFDPPRGASESAPLAGRPHQGSPYWSVLKIPTIRWIIITGALSNFNMYAIPTFLPAYLSRIHSLNLKEANTLAAITFGLTGIPGLLLGGW